MSEILCQMNLNGIGRMFYLCFETVFWVVVVVAVVTVVIVVVVIVFLVSLLSLFVVFRFHGG